MWDIIKSIWSTINDAINLTGGWLSVGAFIWSVYIWLYYNNIKVYLFVNRLLRKRKEVFFEVSFTYLMKDEVKFYTVIERVLKEIYTKDKIKKEANSSNNKIYNVPPYLIQVQKDTEINASNGEQEIFIHMPKIRTTYASVERILESIYELDEKIKDACIISEKKYTMNIVFEEIKNNPFLRLIIKVFGEGSIERFSCKLNCSILSSELENRTIDIYNNKISITNKSFSEIKKITPYLLLLKK